MPIRSTTIVAVVIAFVVAAVVARIASIIIQRTLDALDTVSTENRAAVRHRGRQLARALTLLAYGVAALARQHGVRDRRRVRLEPEPPVIAEQLALAL